jgi:23S rRNA (uracil1939-C5)-methyltransferase
MRALDLYCGVGAIALLLARAGAAVHGIEESPRAVRDARANAKANDLADVRFEEGDAAQVLPRLAREGMRVDLVTLNPPRRGAAHEVREAIAQLAPKRIVYLSCDPETLARDLDGLAQHGYAARLVEPFDFLPHTEHVEAVALAERD